ncbi:MAG: thioredoxin family protein [Deltaproteobacteria bacterium]|nr:thioredoxin family protein [Deltaproteobacteria bacterium]MBI4223914.1 thioredoxin family protein [Deltaproteobacteria bacterium]
MNLKGATVVSIGFLKGIQPPFLLFSVPFRKAEVPQPRDIFLPELPQIEFEQKILRSPGKALVMFSAPWCQQCQPLKAVVKEAARIFRGALDVYQMDFDRLTEDFQERWNPQKILPMILLFDDGRLAGTQAGSSPLTEGEKKTLRFSPASFEKNRQRLLTLIRTKLKIEPPK